MGHTVYIQVIPGNQPKHVSTNRKSSLVQDFAGPFQY